MNTILKSLLPIVIIMAFSSCEDWLNQEPENDVIRQEFWKTKEHVNGAVIGCYEAIQEDALCSRLFLWSELRGGMLMEMDDIATNFYRILISDITSDNDVFKWESFYKAINYCNTVIDNAAQAQQNDLTFTEEELNAYLAEALTLRSLLYFYLVRSFGDVPLMIHGITSDQEDFFVAKSSQEKILNRLIQDLETAENGAVTSYGYNDINKGRITKYAVNALQADIYLWMNNYEKCIESCDKIIDSKRFTLVPGADWVQKIFIEGNSTESIFELQFNSGKTNVFYNYFHPTGGDKEFFASYQVYNLYSIEDVRGDSATYFSYAENPVVWKYLTYSSEYIISRPKDYSTANWIFYRYADILLMKAEALNELAGESDLDMRQDAIDIVESIQIRANAFTSFIEETDRNALAGIILEERKKELAYEGKRWYDVLRNAKRNDYERISIIFETIEASAPAEFIDLIKSKYSDPESHYFPIYYKELELNKNLKQNGYYLK